MNPERNPRRGAVSSVPTRRSRGEGNGMGAVAVLAVCLLCGIAYVQWIKKPQAASPEAAADVELAGAEGSTPFRPSFSGPKPEVVEAPIQKAKSIAQDRYAAPVTHVADNDTCRSLRSARARVQEGMAKPHSAAQAKEYQLDLKSISQRGAADGCWSGGG